MNAVDAIVLGLLAIADLALLAHMRGRHARRAAAERTRRALRLAVRREIGMEMLAPKDWSLRRAS